MLEFYRETLHRSKKERCCECCGGIIKPGEMYFSERGLFEGDFFVRALHPVCHFMEAKYCSEVDDVFAWDEVINYTTDETCRRCKNVWKLDEDGEEYWDDCEISIADCPRIKEMLFSEYHYKEDENARHCQQPREEASCAVAAKE